MSTIRVHIDPATAGPQVSHRLFGTLVEHMGRCVYGGIYEPGHPSADEHGFRADVLELVREIGFTTARYPGGNFVSGYRWEDGVGPAEERPVRLDPAWHSVETNRFGLHEMAAWAELAGVEIVEAVNLGTRGLQEAADLLEYANHPGGTALSELRRAHGASEPLGIRTWCLGNEMDGPWQVGHKTAYEYGRLAAETARLMRMVDPGVELVAAGSSGRDMATFGSWERTVLQETAGLVDHLSLHAYYHERDGDVASFLASGVGLDRFVEEVGEIIDEVCADLEPQDRPRISVDEWNVWYQDRWNDVDKQVLEAGPWQEAPRLLEDEYNVTDGIVVGALLISLVRHAGRVEMANLAQAVNVIGPIRAEPDGPAWRQTTFDPFALTSRHARGRVVLPVVSGAPSITTTAYGEVAALDSVATVSDDGSVTVLLLHRDPAAPASVLLEVPAGYEVELARTLDVPPGGDRFTTNTADAQPVAARDLACRVSVEEGGTTVAVTLAAPSWAIVVLRPGGR
jgi:alpha-N-arabinofuranosidase